SDNTEHYSAEFVQNAPKTGESWVTPNGSNNNKTVLYLKDEDVTVYNRFKMSIAIPGGVTLKLDADSGVAIGGLQETSVTFDASGYSTGGKSVAGVAGFIEFAAKANTANEVKKEQGTFVWNVTKITNKTTGTGTALTTDQLTFYTILDVPKYVWSPNDTTKPDSTDPTKTVPNDDKTQPWVSALEFTIQTSATNGKDSDSAALSQLTTFLHSGFGLTYDTAGGDPNYTNKTEMRFDLTRYMTKASGNVVNCYDQASSVTVLGRLLGIGVDLTMVTPFGYINEVNLVGVGNCNNPFFGTDTTRIIVPVVDAARTQFGMHAFAVYNDGVYDACAGPVTGVARRTYLENTIDFERTIQLYDLSLKTYYEDYYLALGKLWNDASQLEKIDFYLDVVLSMQVRVVTIV
ncbi:MAG: hypothetical protein LBU65_05645, partial [Planctomycetaceae bacterium]|nr:hypothetical protein [Planctomycetaceae bacterium]